MNKQYLLLATAVFAVSTAHAAPGVISQDPLLIPSGTKPNVFYMIDDSVSMASEVLLQPNSDYVLDIGEGNLIDVGVLNLTPDLSGTIGTSAPVPSAQNGQLANLCVGNNALAFDDSKTYTAWFGVDSAGNPYGDQLVTAARTNPYLAAGETRDLSSNLFVDSQVSGCTGFIGTDVKPVSDLSAAQQTNYANWYSYYRKREYVVKRALSEVIWNSTYRVGLASVSSNDGLTTAGLPIGIELADVETGDAELTPAQEAVRVANRDARLKQLFELNTNPRNLLQEIFETVDLVSLFDDLLGNALVSELLLQGVTDQIQETLGPIGGVLDLVLGGVADLQTLVLGAASDGIRDVLSGINDQIDAFNALDFLNLIPDVPEIDIDNLVSDVLRDVVSGQLLNQLGLADLLFDAGQRGTALRPALNDVAGYYADSVPAGRFAVVPTVSAILPEAEGGQCQQNFAVIVTDGGWNGDNPPAVGNADGDANTLYDGRSYADPFQVTLADIAMFGYENDLRADLDNTVPLNRALDDVNPAQHMTTHAVGIGLQGNLSSNPPNRDDAFNWSNPDPSPPLGALLVDPSGTGLTNLLPIGDLLSILGGVVDQLAGVLSPIDTLSSLLDQLDPATSRARVDDMRHAAWNGRGLFNSAFSVESLIDSITEIENDIQDRIGTQAEAGVSIGDTGSVALFQTAFDSSYYSGLLSKRNITFTEQEVDGETVKSASLGDVVWEAGALLEARDLTTDKRFVYTHNGASGVKTGGLEFCWPTAPDCGGVKTLSNTQQADLLANYQSGFGTTDEWGIEIVNYLKGLHDREVGVSDTVAGGLFRFRGGNRLGDIIHSSAVFVGKPQPVYPGRGTPYPDSIVTPTPLNDLDEGEADPRLYSTFVADKQARQAMIYAGANDGMLHAFNADSGENGGKERFAYMPGFLFSSAAGEGVHALADPSYRHRYYVDATPVIADVFLDGEWRTILAGVAGAGGKGLYVLDITDPASGFDESNILFEFTHPQLGLGFGQPVISKIARGDSDDDNWAIILPSGYQDAGPSSSSGTAKLFVIYLDGSNLSNPTILDTGAGSIANADCSDAASNCNGLSTPNVVDSNGDGSNDRIYAGDLLGNLWVFEEPVGDGALNWQVANGGQPLFIARDSSGGIQPITTRPSVTRLRSRPEFTTSPNILVFFGTGQYLTETDPVLVATDSFYSVWDTGSAVSGGATARTNLFERSITTTADGATRFISSNDFSYTPNASNGIRGWFFDTPDGVERFTTAPQINEDTVLVNSLIPSVTACEFAGNGFAYAFNAKTGKPPFRTIFSGAPLADNDDNAAGQAITGLPARSIIVNNTRITASSASATPDVEQVEALEDNPAARQSWQDLEAEQ